MSKPSSRKADRVVRHTLADGTVKEYRYPPGIQRKHQARRLADTIGALIESWQRSPEWRKLASNTQAGYITYTKPLLGMQHVAVKRITRREMNDIRDALAEARGNGAANGFVRAAGAMFSWAIERGWIDHSPMTKVKHLEGGHLPAWTQAEAEWAIRALPEHLRRPIVLALHTGQRRGDLINLPWSAYDGRAIRLRQQKTHEALVIPCHPVLRAELDGWRAKADPATLVILTNRFGRPWTPSNLSKQLGMALAEIPGFPSGRNIHGLRKLAAANLAQAGCTLHEIAAITGHRSLAMLQLYTASVDQERLATSAIVRLATNAKKTGKPA